jgi:predicted nucleotidyltransferase
MKKEQNWRKALKPDVRKDIEGVIAELKRIRTVKAVYLFGSQATGKARPYSDIDICVVAKMPLCKKDRMNILGPSSQRICIHLFHELPVYIKYGVIKHGIALYIDDVKYLHDTAVSAIQNYLDFKPLIDRHCEITMRNLS